MQYWSTLSTHGPARVIVLTLLLLIETSCANSYDGPRMCFTCDSRDADVIEREVESMACPDLKFQPLQEMLTVCPETYSCVTVIFFPEDIDKTSTDPPENALITKRFCSLWGQETCNHMRKEITDIKNCTMCDTNLCNAPSGRQGICSAAACKSEKTVLYNVFIGLSYMGAILCAIEILLIVYCIGSVPIRRCVRRSTFASIGSNSQITQNDHPDTPPVAMRLGPNILRLTAGTSHEFHRSCSQLRALQRPHEFIH